MCGATHALGRLYRDVVDGRGHHSRCRDAGGESLRLDLLLGHGQRNGAEQQADGQDDRAHDEGVGDAPGAVGVAVREEGRRRRRRRRGRVVCTGGQLRESAGPLRCRKRRGVLGHPPALYFSIRSSIGCALRCHLAAADGWPFICVGPSVQSAYSPNRREFCTNTSGQTSSAPAITASAQPPTKLQVAG